MKKAKKIKKTKKIKKVKSAKIKVEASYGHKVPEGWRRSPKWKAIRNAFLKGKVCAVCGRKTKLEAHHIKPFHLFPRNELLISNLIALCENKNNGINCHLLVGHLGSFLSYNENVKADAHIWNIKMKTRPKGKKAA
ncbi:MAG: HNH endonuclease [Pseudobdellovibrionaceae bacterium]